MFFERVIPNYSFPIGIILRTSCGFSLLDIAETVTMIYVTDKHILSPHILFFFEKLDKTEEF